jgi:ketosteroid isomerase-like protein
MTRGWCFLAVLAIAAAGCGGDRSPKTPAQVVRAWSTSFNRGDDEAAAALFGPNVVFVAGDYQTVLRTREQVLAFHREMVWCGPIVRLHEHGDEVEAQFSLASRPNAHCERGGRERGSVYFRVRDGKIVFFDQIGE